MFTFFYVLPSVQIQLGPAHNFTGVHPSNYSPVICMQNLCRITPVKLGQCCAHALTQKKYLKINLEYKSISCIFVYTKK
jgi:hypothetical protein